MTAITLSNILKNFYSIDSAIDREISGLALDSRLVKPGDVFFACKGTHEDGRKYIADAIGKGAQAIITESETDKLEFFQSIPVVPIKNLNHKIAELAARFFSYPAKKMQIVGITGTNGKTSCSHFIGAALQQIKIPCGIIGTLGSGIYGDIKEGSLTTPDAITLQKTFAELLTQNVKHIAMEASSHSIDQGRINNIQFAVGIFTNLTRDHLDYHGTMEAYGAAKRKLFENDFLKQAVINADDKFGNQLILDLHKDKNIFAYGLNKINKFPGEVPYIYAEKIHLDNAGIRAHIHTPWGEGALQIPLIGQFNLSNALATLTTLCLLEIPLSTAIHCLSQIRSVPGRMQMLGGKSNPLVIVDYAHTPDALEKVLHALKQHSEKKLICVFGCGGDRDKGKRPLMAKIAEQYADKIIVTSDNPRFEDPEQIITEIMSGFIDRKKIHIQADRALAIKEALKMANAQDCVLIAGKGAETYQIIGDKKNPFSDVEQVQALLTNTD